MCQYILFHKPYRVLSQFSEEGDKLTLAAYFEGIAKNIYPVGRLDYDSEGLLLLTDDKALTHRLLEPSFGHERTYWVQVEGEVTDGALQELRTGVELNIDGKKYRTKKARCRRLELPAWVAERDPPIRFRKNIPTSWIELVLTEGKNRQVRKMTAAVGLPTLRLIRYAIGKVTLEGLPPGQHRLLDTPDLFLAKGNR